MRVQRREQLRELNGFDIIEQARAWLASGVANWQQVGDMRVERRSQLHEGARGHAIDAALVLLDRGP